MTQRCRDRIYDHVMYGGIYTNIHGKIRSELEEMTTETADGLAQAMEEIHELIKGDIASIEVANESSRDRYPALFDELDRVLPQASRFIDSLREAA